MDVVESESFERSTVRERLESPEEYFARLLDAGVAQRHARVRKTLAEERAQVVKVWQAGDELWRWQDFPSGGAAGLAVLRGGKIVRVWFRHRVL